MHSQKIRTKAQRVYLARFVIRCAVFVGVVYIYLFRRDSLDCGSDFFDIFPKWSLTGKLLAVLLWCAFMAEMLRRMIPCLHSRDDDFLDIGCSKQFAQNHIPAGSYDGELLRLNMRKKDIGALKVAVLWFVLAAAVLALRISGVFKTAELLLIWVVCYILDIVCILFFCPLQTFLMKNRCCATCRIFRWDHFLMYTVLAFIPNFFTLSLFAVSLIELFCWELSRQRHPERFWEGSNANLQCRNCTDRLCEYKKSLSGRGETKKNF